MYNRQEEMINYNEQNFFGSADPFLFIMDLDNLAL